MKVNNMKKVAILGSSITLGLFSAFVALAETVTIEPHISATNFGDFLRAIATGVAAIIGPASILMVVIAGVLFVTSGGSPEKLKVAKTCLLYAIIGGLVAGSAAIIVNTFLAPTP